MGTSAALKRAASERLSLYLCLTLAARRSSSDNNYFRNFGRSLSPESSKCVARTCTPASTPAEVTGNCEWRPCELMPTCKLDGVERRKAAECFWS